MADVAIGIDGASGSDRGGAASAAARILPDALNREQAATGEAL
jgi:hypothetical protein